VIEVPEGADAALAAGLGIAGLAGWLPFAWRAPLTGGETVLVLGATGSVGLVAVQAARLLGAARVVAAGRSPAGLERAAQCGADAMLRLDEPGDLVAAFKEAFGGDGPSYVFDALWGEPAAAAIQAAAPGATIVNLGQSAGATAELASAAVRFKSLSILGHTNYAVPSDELAEHYRRLVGHALAGEIRLDVERVPLDSVTDAWRRQTEGAGTKIVVVP
jgi:NADPH2:quinone reductase